MESQQEPAASFRRVARRQADVLRRKREEFITWEPVLASSFPLRRTAPIGRWAYTAGGAASQSASPVTRRRTSSVVAGSDENPELMHSLVHVFACRWIRDGQSLFVTVRGAAEDGKPDLSVNKSRPCCPLLITAMRRGPAVDHSFRQTPASVDVFLAVRRPCDGTSGDFAKMPLFLNTVGMESLSRLRCSFQ